VFPQNAERGPVAVSSFISCSTARPASAAMIDGEALTNRRTARLRHSHPAICRAWTPTLLMVGTGHLAPNSSPPTAPCVDRKGAVWGRNPQRARALADTLVRQGVNAAPVVDLAEVFVAGRYRELRQTSTELWSKARCAAGNHLDLVGAFTPQMARSDDEVICGAASSSILCWRAGRSGRPAATHRCWNLERRQGLRRSP